MSVPDGWRIERVAVDRLGRWYARANLGRDPLTGRRRRPQRTFPRARGALEARRMAEEWLESLPGYLTEQLAAYVDALEAGMGASGQAASANTVRAYRGYVRNHVAPLMGGAVPARVTPARVTELELALMRPRAAGGHGLSRSTVASIHWFLAGAFTYMERVTGTVVSNPVRAAAHPAPERAEAVVLDAGAAARVRDLAARLLGSDAPLDRARGAFVLLGLNLGLRAGEACALPRGLVDLSRRAVRVAGTVSERTGEPARVAAPKTAHARRWVSMGPGTADALWALMSWQDGAIGGLSASSPVVTVDGSLLRPSAMSRWFSAEARRMGLPAGTRYHTLRHTHATLLLAQGMDARTVQERLGHARVDTTLQLYGHVLPGRDAQAADEFERILVRRDG